ncbi:hypothetical protein GCM10029976_008900 [Kribbella albertanoniae]|uniref:phospholipase D n=1 Tax=Kribbella albertanoniae TaxID=1266829 RepID=A0A4R4Q528_9ACTN|nr:phospholipase D-like domain-containing protein [Kribbella albertanoniae]TDC30198.1 phosphatidylserine/phosphatidylglycerophosphate/cardiolipin synthase family protein [Kribbella albertanoniae]
MKPTQLLKTLVIVMTTSALAIGPVHAKEDDDAPDTPEMFVANDPNGSKNERYRIRDYLVNLIEGAEKNSDITIASYRFNDDKVAEALVDAMKSKNVRVRVIADSVDQSAEPYRKVWSAAKSPSWIEHCGHGYPDPATGNKHTSCIGEHIMHNKFFLFEKTHGVTNVVVQTSSNLNTHSGPKMWNTAYTAIAESWLYNKHQAYFDDLAAAKSPAEGDENYYQTNPPAENGKYKVYFSPRAKGADNVTFANILSHVRCDGNSSGGTDDGNRTIVRVAANTIRGAGGTAVADRLWKLDNQGCYVDIVGTDLSQAKDGPLRGGLLRAPTGKYHGPEVREFSENQCGTHEKNILIDGFYDGKPDQKVVFTGSHNLNNKSPWYNDETILRITDPKVHEEFKKHFFKIRDEAAITWQTSKYETTDPAEFDFEC